MSCKNSSKVAENRSFFQLSFSHPCFFSFEQTKILINFFNRRAFQTQTIYLCKLARDILALFYFKTTLT